MAVGPTDLQMLDESRYFDGGRLMGDVGSETTPRITPSSLAKANSTHGRSAIHRYILSPGSPFSGLSDVRWLAIASKLYPTREGSQGERPQRRKGAGAWSNGEHR